MVRPLSIQDLEFTNTVVECESASGVRFTRLVRTGMPKITPNATRCVFYLYRSEKEARTGQDPQGTGFLVAEPSTVPYAGYWQAHVYAVTNWHVAVEHLPDDPPAPVIRLNRKDGEPHVIPLGIDDWRGLPDLDIVVTPIDIPSDVNALAIPSSMIVTQSRVGLLEIGVGEDVFMMGLFVDHHGGTTNVPAARFGNISMMPNPRALVDQGNLPDVEAYVLDMHSRSGFSGSPVFVYRTFGSDLAVPISSHFSIEVEGTNNVRFPLRPHEPQRERYRLKVKHETMFELLGIHYAQFPEEFESEKAGVITGLSGMTCALPAWHLEKLLTLPEFVDMRAEKDKALEKKHKKKPRPERSKPPKSEKPEGDREAFKRLLGAAVRSPKSSG
jgi:hypothetical protein